MGSPGNSPDQESAFYRIFTAESDPLYIRAEICKADYSAASIFIFERVCPFPSKMPVKASAVLGVSASSSAFDFGSKMPTAFTVSPPKSISAVSVYDAERSSYILQNHPCCRFRPLSPAFYFLCCQQPLTNPAADCYPAGSGRILPVRTTMPGYPQAQAFSSLDFNFFIFHSPFPKQ